MIPLASPTRLADVDEFTPNDGGLFWIRMTGYSPGVPTEVCKHDISTSFGLLLLR
jgi:hypothetical protein